MTRHHIAESRRSGPRPRRHLLRCTLLLPSTIRAATSTSLISIPPSTSAPCCIRNSGRERSMKRQKLSGRPLDRGRGPPRSLLCRDACRSLRGGDVEQESLARDGDENAVDGDGSNDGDAEIDAYIEQLIASVDDEPGDDISGVDGAKTSAKYEEQGGASALDSAFDDETVIQDKSDSESVQSTPSDATSREESDPDAALGSNGATSVREGEPIRSSSTDDGKIATAEQKSSADKSEPGPAAEENSASTGAFPTEGRPPLAARARLPPPNPLYRALLRRRRWGGHVIAMALVTLSELCELWLPGVARAWQNLVWNSLVAREDRSGGHPRGRRRGAGAEDLRPATAQQLESQLRSSERSGTSRKQLKKLQQQVDRAALQVLSLLTKNSKYRYTSLAFQRRHGLGPFAPGAASRVESSGAAHQGEGAISAALQDVRLVQKKRRRKPTGDESIDEEREADEEEDDDVEWILEALTTSKRNDEVFEEARLISSTRTNRGVRPRVELEVGPGGPSVSLGVDFSLGGGKRAEESTSLESVLRDASSKGRSKRATGRVVTSDRDSGVLGRIRAAASDSIGRSLLGAYPGDAVPMIEAANPRGVIDLASRYGYGHWSDDDEEEDDHEESGQKAQRRKGRKRKGDSHAGRSSPSRSSKKAKKTRSVFGVEFGLAVNDRVETASRSSSRGFATEGRAPSSSPSRKSASQLSRAVPSKRRVGRSTSEQSRAPGSREPESTRRAMDRVDETRRKPLSSSGRGASIRPAMELVNEAKRRRGAILDDSGE